MRYENLNWIQPVHRTDRLQTAVSMAMSYRILQQQEIFSNGISINISGKLFCYGANYKLIKERLFIWYC